MVMCTSADQRLRGNIANVGAKFGKKSLITRRSFLFQHEVRPVVSRCPGKVLIRTLVVLRNRAQGSSSEMNDVAIARKRKLGREDSSAGGTDLKCLRRVAVLLKGLDLVLPDE